MNMYQQCTFAAMVNKLLDSIRQSIASRLREVTFPLFSDLVRHIWSNRFSSELTSYKEDMDLMEQVQCRAKNIIKGV